MDGSSPVSREAVSGHRLAQSLSQTLGNPPHPRHADVGVANNPDSWGRPASSLALRRSRRDHRDLQLTELDRIAVRRHRHLEPRWADRPAVWRSLLSVASAPESAAMKRVDAYGLQLLTGDLVPITQDLLLDLMLVAPIQYLLPGGLNGQRRSRITTIFPWPRPFPYRAAHGAAASAHSSAITVSA